MRPLLLLLPLLLLACDPGGGLPAEGCAQDLDCPNGQLCREGACVAEGASCEADFTRCGPLCVDLDHDVQNCGACEAACELGRGCVDGACCPPEAKAACGGACVDVASDAQHCGGCGAPCAEGQQCSAGVCCGPDELACEGICRAPATDPGACGACGVRCPSGAACVEGRCATCPAGTELVDCGAVEACLPPDAPRAPCMLAVPAATFTAGFHEAWDDAYPVHQVTITRGFWLDLTEVTAAQYFPCVEAGVCRQNGVLPHDTEPWLPATWLAREDALVFCAFRGDRLPTEAEWELAARGTDARPYPWGEAAIDCTRANFNKCGSNLRETGRRPRGVGPYGHLELAGNAAEWVTDLFAPYPPEPLLTDPTGPTEGSKAVRRGGHFDTGDLTTSGYARDAVAIDYFDSTTGVRCLRERP